VNARPSCDSLAPRHSQLWFRALRLANQSRRAAGMTIIDERTAKDMNVLDLGRAMVEADKKCDASELFARFE